MLPMPEFEISRLQSVFLPSGDQAT